MKGFDKAISKYINESLFSDDDLNILNIDDKSEILSYHWTFEKLLNEWDKLGLFKLWDISPENKYISKIKYVNLSNNVVKIDNLFIYLNNDNNLLIEFCNLLNMSNLKLDIDNFNIYVCHRNYLNTIIGTTLTDSLIKVSFGSLFHDIKRISKLFIYGGSWKNLKGCPVCHELTFENSNVESLYGVYDNISILQFYYNKDNTMSTVKDWSDLPYNLKELKVKYQNRLEAIRSHAVHFTGLDERIINIEGLDFLSSNEYITKTNKTLISRYIKNVFMQDNPEVKKTIVNKIANVIILQI